MVRDCIDLEKEDKDYDLRDAFLIGTVHAGADTVSKLMAVTYLSQFEDLGSEFITRPPYRPDFHIGYIPYSNELITVVNDVHRRGHIHLPSARGELTTHHCEQMNIDYLVEKGAQLGRLYLKNKELLERSKGDWSGLFRSTIDCFSRDLSIFGKNLAYAKGWK